MAEPRFTPETFRFLTELALNNSRTWFEANKARYEALVREPALAFIRGAGPHLRKISRHLVASDRKIGGSLMRVHRDVRFSRDKSPYKTNVGIQFRHEVGKDVHAPGLYVHIAPDECFLGAGVWHPERLRKFKMEKQELQKKLSRIHSLIDKVDERAEELETRTKQEGLLKNYQKVVELSERFPVLTKRRDKLCVAYAMTNDQIYRMNISELYGNEILNGSLNGE